MYRFGTVHFFHKTDKVSSQIKLKQYITKLKSPNISQCRSPTTSSAILKIIHAGR